MRCIALLVVPALLHGGSAPRSGARPSVAARRAWVVEEGEPRRVLASLDFRVDAGASTTREWLLVAASPPVLPGQRDVHVESSPPSQSVTERGPLHRPLLLANMPTSSRAPRLAWHVDLAATLVPRRLVRHRVRAGDAPAPVTVLDEPGRQAALGCDGRFDWDAPVFQRWLDRTRLRRAGGDDVEFARLVYLALRRDMKYECPQRFRLQASVLCQVGRSDCGGTSLLFASVLRANGIPARTLFGHWAHSAVRGETLGGTEYHQEHVKAEFWAEGVGWVPVDVTTGAKEDWRSCEGFGRDLADFIVLHVDPDIIVPTPRWGDVPVPWLQSPVAWAQDDAAAERPGEAMLSWRVW